MDETPTLNLPFIMPSQAQKHVTHNESLLTLDALVQLAVADRDLASPPGSPEDGACYIVAAPATGAWSGHDGEVAAWREGAWRFHAPRPGWVAWVTDETAACYWTGSAWAAVTDAIDALQNLSLLGVGAAADATNPFSAKLNKALWAARETGEGGDGSLRVTMNKETATDTNSLLMQSGWSGRAEIGLCGDDDLSVKVSPDGSAWTKAMTIEATSARPCFPQGLVHASGAAVAQYLPTDPGSIWRLDVSRTATPRTASLSSVSGTTLTLSTADAGKIFGPYMRGLAAVRVWNTSKSPAEPAWVDYDLSSSSLRVTDAAAVASWSASDTLQLGDPNPTGDNVLQMVALDISGFLQARFGSVFPQKGLLLYSYVSSTDGPSGQDYSGTGASGTAQGGNALGDGARNTMSLPVVTPTPSPISNSNLVFVRESLAGGSTDIGVALARVLGVYA